MKYSVEVYIPNKEKYSSFFKGMSDIKAAEKVINNIYIHGCNGNSASAFQVLDEILSLKPGENLLYWCDSIEGAYSRVTAI